MACRLSVGHFLKAFVAGRSANGARIGMGLPLKLGTTDDATPFLHINDLLLLSDIYVLPQSGEHRSHILYSGKYR